MSEQDAELQHAADHLLDVAVAPARGSHMIQSPLDVPR